MGTAPAGLLLAAGAGSRLGLPKALVLDHRGVPWVRLAAGRLIDAGCSPVIAVLGAGADGALDLLPAGVRAVIAAEWADGMSASLRAGLRECESTDAAAVAITLVDLPGLPVAALRRVIGTRVTGDSVSGTSANGTSVPGGSVRGDSVTGDSVTGDSVTGSGSISLAAGAATLRQAVYAGHRGHPVVIGRSHWAAIGRTVSGDEGARRYLEAHGAEQVECSDLWDGRDVDSAS